MALSDNLVAYWSLSDLTDAVGSNTLTNNGGATFVTGKVGNAVSLNGSSQYLSIADNADVSMGDVDFTIAAWVNLESKGSDRIIAGQYNTTGNQRAYLLRFTSSLDRFSLIVSATGAATFGAVLANNLGSPSLGAWYFVVAWHDATANTLNICVNNGAVDSVSHTTGVLDGTADFTLGAYVGLSSLMDGLIDEIGIWKRVLSSTEITDLYNGGSGRDAAYVLGGSGGPTYAELAGSAAGLAGLAANLRLLTALAGQSAGQASVSGGLTLVTSLAGASAGTATVTGNLALLTTLAGQSVGIATTAGDLHLTVGLSGQSAGTSAAVGTLSTGIYADLSGTSAGQATVTGGLTLLSHLVGAAAGSSNATGALRLVVNLEGVSAGSAATVAILTSDGEVVATMAGIVTGPNPEAAVYAPNPIAVLGR